MSPPAASAVACVVHPEPDGVHYRLATVSLPLAPSARVTHLGPCGTCSTLADLAAYLERADLTGPVRQCALMYPFHDGTVRCLEGLGLTPACADTWAWNTAHTREVCGSVCGPAWLQGAPGNLPDGSLSPCLACDEVHSGPLFKSTAGRTRRNSGLRSSIERGGEEIAHLVHDDA